MSFVFILLVSGLVFANSDTVINLKDWVKVQIVSPLEENGAIPVNIQDQTTRPVILYLNQVKGVATLTENFSLDDITLTLNDTTGITIGDYIAVFSVQNGIYYTGNVLDINGNILTVDTPSDFNFIPGDPFRYAIKKMNVDGSITPQVFSLKSGEGLDITIDVTRIIFHILDQSAMDDNKFGGIPSLEKGIVLRKKDGTYQNLFNVKSNGEIGELAYDKEYDNKAPAGFYGFTSRLTFAGQNKMGVAIRISQEDDLQLIIQDDLTLLDDFRIIVEGHIVQN